jgi:hypothetical protein
MQHRSTISRRDVLAAGAALAMVAAAGPVRAQAATADQPVVLITGTSSGFGRLMVETFARNDLRVIATMRNISGRNASAAAELRALASKEQLPINVVEIDVTD